VADSFTTVLVSRKVKTENKSKPEIKYKQTIFMVIFSVTERERTLCSMHVY